MAEPAGWQPDPTGKHDHRYWDGTAWTEHVANAGVASIDPYEAGGSTPPPDAPTLVTPVSADDTASYPTAGPPGPYAPPPPVATGGTSPAEGRSRRRLAIGGGILAAVALAVIAILALGGDDEPTGPLGDESAQTTGSTTTTTETTSPGRGDGGQDEQAGPFPDDQIGDILEETYGFSHEQATCLADRIGEAIQDGELDQEVALSRMFEYFSDCDISLEDLAGEGGD
jgi:hypothetical protein